MKFISKVLFVSVLFLSVLSVGTSCSDSSDDSSGGGSGSSGGSSGPTLVQTWEYSIEYTRQNVRCTDYIRYELYSENKFACTFTTTPGATSTYTGIWERYSGDFSHTYHFKYSTSLDDIMETWGDVSNGGMVLYTTESRDFTDEFNLVHSTRWPNATAVFH